MLAYFPKQFARKSIGIYVLALMIVSIVFMDYAMKGMFMVAGFVLVGAFFYGSHALTVSWNNSSEKRFVKNLFWTALALRVAWVVASYYFFIGQTGQPFEWDTVDAFGYHGDAEWLSRSTWATTWYYLFESRSGYSDSGYCLYLTLLYKIFGSNVMVARLFKALYGSILCVLIYKLASRSVNKQVGKMAAVFAMLMPNLIYYCGLHLKETEMTFLIVLFLERADFVLRSEKIKFWNILLPILIAGSLFLFRTVVGVVALFSFMTALAFGYNRMVKKGRRVVLALWVVIGVSILAGGTVINEVEEVWLNRHTNQEYKRMEQTSRGNQWAQYATGVVMAPMAFVVPFATMVDVDEQYAQQLIHGGAFAKNIMGIFVLLAFYYVFKGKKWRDFSLLGAFVIAYLAIISFSGFANSERFHFPALPVLLIMWAYGLSQLNAKNYRWVNAWYFVVLLMEFGWAFFKLGSRGFVSF